MSRHQNMQTNKHRIPLPIDDTYSFMQHSRGFRLFSRVFRRFAIIVLSIHIRFFFGLRLRGKENLHMVQGGMVSICNHVNMLDCAMIGCALHKRLIHYPTLKSNLEIPVIRKLVKVLGGFPIPETGAAFLSFAQKVKELLTGGDVVHLFPEGSLEPYHDGIRPFEKGAFSFAYDCNVPILPFVITYHEITGVRRLFRRKPDLALTILPPVMPDQNVPRGAEVNRLRAFCHDEMSRIFENSRPQPAYQTQPIPVYDTLEEPDTFFPLPVLDDVSSLDLNLKEAHLMQTAFSERYKN